LIGKLFCAEVLKEFTEQSLERDCTESGSGALFKLIRFINNPIKLKLPKPGFAFSDFGNGMPERKLVIVLALK
jgi:hypothetical protein